ncbi:hypothetical protein [Sandarakinorhabdus sp.]|uniref:hypothetical protein n=1 Tax=Sandarakinorhabdus sp. TaxID=1916663 RepID=UPI003F729078
MRIFFLCAALVALPATATEVVRLTDSERAAVLDAAALGPERSAVLTPETNKQLSVLDRSLYPEFYGDGPAVRDRKVHGEMTMFAGSGGTFGMSGTAVVPVGESGSAAISVLQGRSRWGGNMQGYSLGFASGGVQGDISSMNGFGGGFGGPFGPGLWTTPWGASPYPGPPMRRWR